MAIQFTGLSNQGNVAKSERSQKEDVAGNSIDKPAFQSGGKMAEDTVKLSGAAQTLQSQQSKINDRPEINRDKVDQIKRSIEANQYKIDTQKLASNMTSMDSLF